MYICMYVILWSVVMVWWWCWWLYETVHVCVCVCDVVECGSSGGGDTRQWRDAEVM